MKMCIRIRMNFRTNCNQSIRCMMSNMMLCICCRIRYSTPNMFRSIPNNRMNSCNRIQCNYFCSCPNSRLHMLQSNCLRSCLYSPRKSAHNLSCRSGSNPFCSQLRNYLHMLSDNPYIHPHMLYCIACRNFHCIQFCS